MKEFVEAKIEVIHFSASDVIATSSCSKPHCKTVCGAGVVHCGDVEE